MTTKRGRVGKPSRNKKKVTRKAPMRGNTAAGARRRAARGSALGPLERPMAALTSAAHRLWLTPESAAALKLAPARRTRPKTSR